MEVNPQQEPHEGAEVSLRPSGVKSETHGALSFQNKMYLSMLVCHISFFPLAPPSLLTSLSLCIFEQTIPHHPAKPIDTPDVAGPMLLPQWSGMVTRPPFIYNY